MFKLKMKNKNRLGFTLIELLLVMSIMSILTIVTVSTFTTSQKKARDVKRKADLSSISKALNMYYNDYGKYPNGGSNEPNIDSLIQTGNEFSQDGNLYMKEIPVEKTNGVTRYAYFSSSTGKSFRLWTNLENENDKDCLTSSVDSYTKTTPAGCLYSVYSSNISVGSTLL